MVSKITAIFEAHSGLKCRTNPRLSMLIQAVADFGLNASPSFNEYELAALVVGALEHTPERYAVKIQNAQYVLASCRVSICASGRVRYLVLAELNAIAAGVRRF